jgi:hypothetical protein
MAGAPVIVAQCHCEECRRLSGTGHTIGAMFAWSGMTLHGEIGEFMYHSGTGSEVTKGFCKTCGSPIFGRNTRLADHVTVPLGSIEDTTGLNVQVVIFARDKMHWDELGSDVAMFDTQPDWAP